MKQFEQQQCWILTQDGKPIAVYTNMKKGVLERLRLSKQLHETDPKDPTEHKLIGPFVLIQGGL